MTRFKFSIVSLLIHLVVPTASAQTSGPVSFGPTAYLSSADVPDGFHSAGAVVSLEDFEDGSLDFGITASGGMIVTKATSAIVDSVDADDGFIDGSGLDGASWFFGGGATGVVFTFSEELPTSAGLVWTDGAGTTSFEAFGPGMISLGTIGPVRIADSSVVGTTGDDHFFGVQSAGGILAIKISNTAGGIEVDHVQFSTFSPELGPTTVGFNLPEYTAEAGVPLAGSVVIDPLPPGGIYSQGMVINVRSEDGTLAGVVTPAAASRLSNDGPLLGEAGAEMSETGLGGVKGTALFSTARSVLTDPTLASFTLADLPPGSYTLEIEPWNELGPTEDIFVTGRCLTLDSFITFGTATLEVTGIFVPEITITGPIVLQSQTGLLEQTLTVTNNSGRVLDSFRVFIGGLPAEVIAWNAHGFIDGIPYIDIFTPLGIGESMALVLEYYRPNRQANFTPTFTIDPTTGSPPVVSIAPLAIDLRVVRKGPESLLVEFLTVKDQFYIVEYSNDMITWTSTVPSILGTGERIQWLDQGPPKTASVPGATRFYRITSGNE